MISLYNQDPCAWFALQASFLEQKNFDQLDIINLKEELVEMGESYARELESNLIILIAHLLKWNFQPEMRSKSWARSIKEHRRRVKKRLLTTPSLKYRLFDIAQDAYQLAAIQALEETRIDEDRIPQELPYTLEAILTDDWAPCLEITRTL